MHTPVHEGLFTLDPPALLGALCGECGHHSFPRLAHCPYCGCENVDPVTLSDHGTLWGWTEVTTAPPGYEGVVPFGFGVVELPEGLRIVTRLTSPTATYEYGLAMRLQIVDLGDGVVTWEFTPETGRGV
ncbi:MAG: DNA-binding protein [Acidimicrobiia bacterium]|nr:DNA-binding protein [Acidimicrobiia bacterium]